MIKSIFLDYGGTLDTGGIHWADMIWTAYERAGVSVGRSDFNTAYVETERTLGRQCIIQLRHTFADVLHIKLGLQLEMLHIEDNGLSDEMLDFLLEYVQQNLNRVRPVLQQLSERMPLVLVSNFYGNLTTVLHDFMLDSYFSDVVESAVVGIRKPDPDIFRLALRRNRLCPNEVLVVGDSLKNDIRPAHEAGCTTVWLQPTAPLGMMSDCVDHFVTDLSRLCILVDS